MKNFGRALVLLLGLVLLSQAAMALGAPDLHRSVNELGGFPGHAELAGGKMGGHIFRSLPGQRHFHIMNNSRPVHGQTGEEPAFQSVDNNRAQTDLDGVGSHPQ